uniref:Pro-corazonin n=1 Tax=Nephila sp. SGP-2016 TaxID=1905176 RepID=A0A4Q8K9P2_9ARAC
MKSATAISLLVVLQLVLSTTGQTFQYSQGWTNGRKRSYEVEKNFSNTLGPSLPFSQKILMMNSSKLHHKTCPLEKIIQLLKLEQDDMQQNL